MTAELHQLYRDHISQAERSEFRGFSAALKELYRREVYSNQTKTKNETKNPPQTNKAIS